MIRILVVDELRLVCSVMASALNEEDDLTVVGTATTVEEACAKLSACDIALVSTSLKDNGVMTLLKEAGQCDPQVKVLPVGVLASQAHILTYIENGAAGYVLREDSIDELLKNVRAAAAERALVSPAIAAALMARIAELSEHRPAETLSIDALDLTPREMEVLRLIGREMTNQEIADTLFIELGTVKNHVHKVLSKLNVRSREQAASYLDLIEGNGE